MKAKNQARIFSSTKTALQDAVPLRTPYSVHIDVCSVCNFRCSFCFQSNQAALKEKGIKLGLMDVTLFKKIVDDLTEFEDKIRKIKIGNHGEPTLHSNLPEMIAYASSANVAEEIEMFTHGSKLNPELNLAIVEAGLTRINISVEGLTEEDYQKTAGAKIDIKEFVENIRHLYENRQQLRIYVKIVDVDMSEQDKQLFYDRFGDICDEIFIENVVPQWPESNMFDVETTGMYGQKVRGYKHVCPFPFMYLHFNLDGTTSGCTLDWSREVLIGDVSKESAREIWYGGRLRALQIKLLEKRRKEINICDTCMAPMVCTVDDLDDDRERLLELIRV